MIRDLICDMGAEGATLLEGAECDSAIIGVTHDGRVVYDYDKLVASLGMPEEDAVEWIDYNTIRSIPYMGAQAPVIMYPLPKEELM